MRLNNEKSEHPIAEGEREQINVNIRMWVVHILAPTTAPSSSHPYESHQGAKFRPFLLVQEVANQRTFRGGNFDTRHTRPLIIASTPPQPPSTLLHTLHKRLHSLHQWALGALLNPTRIKSGLVDEFCTFSRVLAYFDHYLYAVFD